MFSLLKTKVPETRQHLVDRFLNDATAIKYIAGRNSYSKALAERVDITAFIDDFSDCDTWLGKPVIRSREANRAGIVCSTSIAIYPLSMMKTLANNGLTQRIHYFDLCRIADFKHPFMDACQTDIENHFADYQLIFEALADPESKKVFSDLVHFKANKDFDFLQGHRVDMENQYFESFLDYIPDKEVFIDAGGFDGFTSRQFIKQCPDYKAVYLFEPCEDTLKQAKNTLSDFSNVHFFQKGLSNKRGQLKFNNDMGSANRITADGNISIDVDRLDDIVSDTVTFIKMDIEGSESEAIEGAADIIQTHKPKLAISVYHRPGDFREIFEQVNTLNPDYNVYLRHYTEGTDETVMFFIP